MSFLFMSMKKNIARNIKGIDNEYASTCVTVFANKNGIKPAVKALIKLAVVCFVILWTMRYIITTKLAMKIFGKIFPTKVKGIKRLKKARI